MAERVLPREWPELETARLRLRRPRAADAPSVFAYCNDREVARNAEEIPWPYTEADAADWVRSVGEDFDAGRGIGWIVEFRAGGGVIGDVCVKVDEAHLRAEVGYVLGRPHWGQGYATEAVGDVVRYCFDALRVRKVFAVAFADNAASRRVLEKCGMRLEVLMRGHCLSGGEPRDDAVFGLLRSEYDGEERAKVSEGQRVG